MFHLETLNDVLHLACGRGEGTALQYQSADGSWQAISGDELRLRVERLACRLQERGVRKGDRIALLSENRWEWPVVDFAALSLGAIDVPLYATVTAEQVGYMLRDSGAKIAFVSTQEQLDKLRSADDLPALRRVVLMDDGAGDGVESFAALMQEQGGSNPRSVAQADVTGADPATIIYTSGTTGEPKGVVLTHGNIAANLNVSTLDFHFDETDSCISFLPLSHVTARHVDYVLLARGASLAYLPKFDQLPAAMKALRPTVFVAVPRVYEKIRHAVESKAGASAMRSRLLRLAQHVGHRHQSETLRGDAPTGLAWTSVDKQVFSKIRDAFGGRVRTFIAGGAPLGLETTGWFADAGIRILEGYGLTETSPVIALNTPTASRMGTVGRVLPNVETRFAADGELEVKGPSVFSEYWQHAKETAEAFTHDGFFKTGDIGRVDADGFLIITDRKKELLKTSGGKLIAPQPIENRLKNNPLIAHAAMVGDGQKFASVLVSPNFEALDDWAKRKGMGTSNRGMLACDAKVQQLYQEIVDGVNGTLAPYETMKKVIVVPEEWSIETGELTPSMKLKRRVIESNYADQIRSLYQD